MRLKKIVLNGFKSFADKTEFKFDAPITAIVGPNGCGKSNVVDAVKWVLGDQSTKSMRSDQMADVIFSGSSSRKPMGSAEVSLFLTNTSGELPIESDEVQVSRRIFNSGESEYRINNKIARLKDIRQMFMDTGIGVKAYSIIEQGEVERLITASKTERREIFEEAAGISKYKAQKKEAIRKLERTEQNLLRLADILAEVQKQLRSVKLQAGKARNYLQYSERLNELQVNYSLVEYHKIRTSTKQKQHQLEDIEEDFAEISSEIAQKDVYISDLARRISGTEHDINVNDNELVSVQSKIEQNLQRIDFLRNRIEELEERKVEAAEKIRKLEAQKKEFEKDIKTSREKKEDFSKSLTEKEELYDTYKAELEEVSTQCYSLEAELEDEKSGIIDIVRRTAQLHNEVQSISSHRSNLNDQKEKLHGRADSAESELENLLTEKAQQKTKLDDIENVLDELDTELNTKNDKKEQVQEELSDKREEFARVKEERSAVLSQLSILKDMEANLEGVSEDAKNILNERSAEEGRYEYIDGVTADFITKVENPAVIEAALEGKADALIVNNVQRLLEDKSLESLEGRVDFICRDNLSEEYTDEIQLDDPDIKARAFDRVECRPGYEALISSVLGRALIVEDLFTALKLRGKYGSFNFVTEKGDKLLADGTVKMGPLGKKTGLISRKNQISTLENQIEEINEKLEEIQADINSKFNNNKHLEKVCQNLRTAIYEANTEKMQVNAKLDWLGENISRLSEEQPLIKGEIENLEKQIEKSVQKEYESKQKLDELESINDERQTRIEELEARHEELKARRNEKSNELTELRVELGQIIEQLRSSEELIKSLQNQIGHCAGSISTNRQEIGNTDEQIRDSERTILNCEGEVSELYLKKEESQEKSRKLVDELQNLTAEKEEAEKNVREKKSKENEIEEKINQLKVELGQLEVKEQSLVDRVRDELQMDLVESYENFEQQDEDVDWYAVKDEINELRGKIKRLGNVNVDAIDEQEELEKRNEFLTDQVEDLNESKTQLEQLIDRLNKESREKFRETFEEIRKQFTQLFRKLFGGGKADIILEEADDILEAGIEVIAKPPGKESRSISLLSGGEKTLTAIALLFSVFKAKPSPFCILDEVDAALDEANNERFNMILKEFEDSSQFIIVTHAKRTMSIADVLYGITMQTRGVSKKISVHFGEEEQQQDSAVA